MSTTFLSGKRLLFQNYIVVIGVQLCRYTKTAHLKEVNFITIKYLKIKLFKKKENQCVWSLRGQELGKESEVQAGLLDYGQDCGVKKRKSRRALG